MDNTLSKGNPIYDAAADTPVRLSETDMREAMDSVAGLDDSIRFLYEKLRTGCVLRSDVKTHLGLLRHTFNDLNRLLDGGSFLDAKLEETTAMLRQANQELHALRQATGLRITAKEGSAFIQAMSRAVTTWYELCGFRYASQTTCAWNITLDFSSEVKLCRDGLDTGSVRSGIKELAGTAGSVTKYQFGDCSGYDLRKEDYHMELLDTDNNRTRLRNLFGNAFPNSQVTDFRSMLDRGIYLLRVSVNIPYEDIEAWLLSTGFLDGKPHAQEEQK